MQKETPSLGKQAADLRFMTTSAAFGSYDYETGAESPGHYGVSFGSTDLGKLKIFQQTMMQAFLEGGASPTKAVLGVKDSGSKVDFYFDACDAPQLKEMIDAFESDYRKADDFASEVVNFAAELLDFTVVSPARKLLKKIGMPLEERCFGPQVDICDQTHTGLAARKAVFIEKKMQQKREIDTFFDDIISREMVRQDFLDLRL